MNQRKLLLFLLWPFAVLYGLGISLRNFFYKTNLLKGVEFDVPTISVGNLSVGGAGKTPHVEHLIRSLREFLNIATISRGYQRKTKGFLEVHSQHTAETVGDEPLQYKRKYPDVLVTVSESRTFAVPEIMKQQPDTQVILLDDAFQHRAIKPGLNILLTEYSYPFTDDFLLPAGRLREWASAYKRADIIIVSKCPAELDTTERVRLEQKIKPLPHQRLYFSFYDYLPPYYIFNPRYRGPLQADWDVLLICAIARTEYLLSYLQERVNSVVLLEYEDHHYFSKFDVGNLRATFARMQSSKKVILTTEKDAMRLDLHRDFILEHKLPIFALPIEVRFHFDEGDKFNEDVQQYLLNFKV
ncbi:MAG: tetraacyldisaccharide 4'-kinase [Bacteroidota bacterium]